MIRRREFLKRAVMASAAAIVMDEHAWAREGLTGSKGREYHVAMDGDDTGDGSKGRPLRTISAAAAHAQPGDTITVYKGIYRERIDPPAAAGVQGIHFQAPSNFRPQGSTQKECW